MRVEHLVESVPRELDLSEQEAGALAAAGKRLAGSREYWRQAGTDADDLAERSVIRCERWAHGRFCVTVREATGIVALPSVQLVVEPKIPSDHFRYLLQRSPAFPHMRALQVLVMIELVALPMRRAVTGLALMHAEVAGGRRQSQKRRDCC
jgi:hypothetical protein